MNNSQVLTYGVAPISFSITNPETSTNDALDAVEPFSLFEYLQYSRESVSPENQTANYNVYLRSWYAISRTPVDQAEENIKDIYINLLRDIALKFTTVEERRFLSNIDFNDTSNLAVALPFYAQKLRDICLYYSKKRDYLAIVNQKNKSRGTANGAEKEVYQLILDYLFGDDGKDNVFSLQIALSTVAANLQIEVEPQYDVYTSYFDVNPQASAASQDATGIREQYFTANTNIITAGLFLDINSQIASEILQKSFYLQQFGPLFTINIGYTVDTLLGSNCSPSDLAKLLQTDVADATNQLNLKKKIIEKYIGVDYYYLSCGNTTSQMQSGVLFKAVNAAANFQNKRFASTASIEADEYKSARGIGCLSMPFRQGIITMTPAAYDFKINAEMLSPNTVYIFPNPEISGNVSNMHYGQLQHPYDFYSNKTYDAKYIDSGEAYGDPVVGPFVQHFYGYNTPNDFIDLAVNNLSAYHNEFASLVNQGVVTDYGVDVYGNEYAVFKPLTKFNRVQTNTNAVSAAAGAYATLVQDAIDYTPNIIALSGATDVASVLSNPATVAAQPSYDISNISGLLYVKSAKTGKIARVATVMSDLFNKYPAAVRSQIYNNVYSMRIIYDVIIIETQNYLIVEKVQLDANGNFSSPNTINTYITHDDATNQHVSNVFLNNADNSLYFVNLATVASTSATNAPAVYPKIYQYRLADNVLNRIYPLASTSQQAITTMFSPSSAVYQFKQSLVNVAYNSRNNAYAASWIGYDLNELPLFNVCTFAAEATQATIQSFSVFQPASASQTQNFYYSLQSTMFSSFSALSSTLTNATVSASNNLFSVYL